MCSLPSLLGASLFSLIATWFPAQPVRSSPATFDPLVTLSLSHNWPSSRSEMSQGYALRTDSACPVGSFSGGGTWGDWQVCCPTETYCPGGQENAECLKSGVGGTLSQCANSTWNLFWKDDFFCCEPGKIGFISTVDGTYGDFGCATDKSFDGDTMSSLTVKIAGTSR